MELCKECKKLNKEYSNMKADSRVNCLAGVGPYSADIMLVGEAPGVEECKAGEPFVGMSGKFLRKQLLNPAGINRSGIRIENAVRCRPSRNRTPTITEIKNCRKYLIEEIKKCKPKVIIAAGKVALSSLTNFSITGIVRWAGKEIWSNEFDCWIVPIMHPSAIMRKCYEYDVLQGMEAMELAKYLADEPLPTIPEVIAINACCHTDNEMLLHELEHCSVFSIDIETGNKKGEGLSNFLVDDILGVSFSVDGITSYYVPFSMFEHFRKDYEAIFNSDRIKVFHNCAFDLKFFKAKGYTFKEGTVFDTQIAHHLIDENFEGTHGLKYLAWRYTYVGGYDLELSNYLKAKKVKDYGDIPLEMLGKYAAYDAIVTYKLYQLFSGWLKEEGLDYLFYNIVMPSRLVLNDMEYTGILVDSGLLHDINNKLEGDIERLDGIIQSYAGNYGLKDFNCNSPKQLQVLLFDKLKLVPLKRTPKGGYSTNEEALELIGSDNKLLKLIIQYRKLCKYNSTYIIGLLDKIDIDGRVHTFYSTTGTVTGRLASSAPNLQNIPTDKDIKTVFISKRGYSFIDADYSQAELRGLAHYSQEPFMIKAYKEDGDIHSLVASEFFGKSADLVSKDERRFIKAINFGIAYGRTAKGLSVALGTSVDEAQEYLDNYFARFPLVRQLIRATEEYALKYGYIKNMFGRRRRLSKIGHDNVGIRNEARRQAINSLIQGTLADVAHLALANLGKAFKENNIDGSILLQVHDSIVCEVRDDQIEKATNVIVTTMEKPIPNFTVALKADVEVCKFWGAKNDSLNFVWRDINEII